MPVGDLRARFDDHVAAVATAIGCVTQRRLAATFTRTPEEPSFLTLHSGNPVRIRGQRRWLDLRIAQRFTLSTEETPRGRSVATVVAYSYQVFDAEGPEILSYHLHSSIGFPRPHLHIKSGAAREIAIELQRAHIPTAEVGVSEFLLLLIREFGVRPLAKDWEERLNAF